MHRIFFCMLFIFIQCQAPYFALRSETLDKKIASGLQPAQRNHSDTPSRSAKNQEFRAITLTFDDLPKNGRPIEPDALIEMHRRILLALTENKIPAIGFVTESNVLRLGHMDARASCLKAWVSAGMDLGNHTFSHFSLHDTPLELFKEDVIKGECLTKLLLRDKGKRIQYFRHPFLRTGPNKQVKEAFENFLSNRGYQVAPITIEIHDWMFGDLYESAKKAGDKERVKVVLEAFLKHSSKALEYFENLSKNVLGYEVKQILLLHANELNADYLPALIALIRERGYRFISLDEALTDPAYKLPDTYIGQMGISWLHRWNWAKGQDVFWKAYNNEPDPPKFIQGLARSY